MSLPIQSSTNDQTSISTRFGASNFGGLNVNNGIKPEWIIGGAVVIVLAWVFVKVKK